MAKERLIHKKEKPLSFDIGFPPSSNTMALLIIKQTHAGRLDGDCVPERIGYHLLSTVRASWAIFSL